MKSILLSIQPYYVFLIIARLMGWNIPQHKTVEVRKDYPKDNAWNRRVQGLYKLSKSFNLYAQAERNELLGIKPNKLQLEFAQRYVYGRSYKKETWNEYKKRNGIKE